MEGGCDDIACDGEQVVTISGYEDVATNDEQALLKAGHTSLSVPTSRRLGGTSLPSLRSSRPPQTATMRGHCVHAHCVARSPVDGTRAGAHRSGRRRLREPRPWHPAPLRLAATPSRGANPTVCDLVKPEFEPTATPPRALGMATRVENQAAAQSSLGPSCTQEREEKEKERERESLGG